MRAAVVDLQTYMVINIIVANASVDAPPDGCMLVQLAADTECNIGWLYSPGNNTFTPPVM